MSNDTSPENDEGAPDHILDLAEGCVRYVEEALDVKLDYTPETLSILDHYISERPDAGDLAIDSLLVPCVGAYFGELVRRNIGSVRWYLVDDQYDRYRLEFDLCYLHFNPMGAAFEAFQRSDQGHWSGHFQMLDEDRGVVEEALERAGSIEEEDYYSLTTRWDVLLMILGVLAERAAQHQGPPRRFGPEVYQALIDSIRPKSPAN